MSIADHWQVSRGRIRWLVCAVGLLVVGLLALAVSPVWGTVLTGPGFNADVSATVTPDRLPQHGSAPVSLAIKGSITPTSNALPSASDTLDVNLDRQLAVRSAGVPVCTLQRLHAEKLQAGNLHGLEIYTPHNMRTLCGDALVGHGAVRFTIPTDQNPIQVRTAVYLFNAHIRGSSARVLVYQEGFWNDALEWRDVALAQGGTHGVQILFGGGYKSASSFEFHFGKTWMHKGRRIGYLSGRCVTGTLSSHVVLTLLNGEKQSGAISQRCTRGS